MRTLRAIACACALVLLAGCATPVFNPASNVPLDSIDPAMGASRDIVGTNAIALSFSGGGLRAAAFSFGVLEALASVPTPEGDLLDDVAFISSVSGGSLTAGYFGVTGREGMPRFRDEVLARGFEDRLRTSFTPWNLSRILGGGLNDRFRDTLDARVFHGATFADLYRRGGPEIRIQASDLYNRIAFPFIPQAFAVLCSDIARYGVADAVAASMAVPFAFAPVVLRSWPERCDPPVSEHVARIGFDADAPLLAKATESAMRYYRDPAHPYVKLADGGLTDNLGLSTVVMTRLLRGTPYAPLSEKEAVRVRRMLFIVVDASSGPAGDWSSREQGPKGLELAVSAANAAVDSAARLAADGFAHSVHDWQQAVIAFRCGLTREQAAALGAAPDWRCDDVRFRLAFISPDRLDDARLRATIDAIPTRLSLTAAEVDAAVEGGRRLALGSPRLHAYLRERVVDPTR